MFNDSDTFDDKYRANETPPPSRGSLGLFDAALDAGGELTDYTRQTPSGRLTESNPNDTGFGVDRSGSGEFVSRDRSPVPQLREEDGTVKQDPFAVGNFDAFGGDKL